MQKTNPDRLKKWGWLLDEKVSFSAEHKNEYSPPYGDVTKLNRCRLILDAVGKETLKTIGDYAVSLLGTSVAVYETNGDYAFGMFSSGWCKMMDSASRELCDTHDNQQALSCGKWLCHEICWNDSAKKAMDTGQPTDIACVGGIHMYAEPIFAGEKIVGAINIGYGDPPKDARRLQELSDLFGIDCNDLKETGAAYKSRPDFMVDLSKNLLGVFAKTIGEIVEKSMLQKSLVQSEARLRTIINRSPFPIAVADLADETISYWSQSAIDTFGHNPKRVSEWYELAYPDPAYREDVINRWKPFLNKASESEKAVYTGEYKIACTDETIRICELYVQIIPGNLIVTFNDITERKKAEHALQKNENKLNNIIENSTNLFYSHSADHEITFVSPQVREVLGYEPEEVMRRWTELATDNPINEEGFKRTEEAIKTGKRQPLYELEMDRKDGRKIWVEVREAPLVENGKVLSIVGSLTDITERKIAEGRIKESEASLRDAQRIANIGNWSLDLQTGSIEMSDEMLNLIGLKDKNKAFDVSAHEEFYTPESWQRFNEALSTARTTGKNYEIKMDFSDKKAKCRHAVARGEAICDENNKIIGLKGTLQDITDQTKSRAALQESEAKYRLLTDNTLDCIWLMDMDLKFSYINPAIYNMFGFTMDEWVGSKLQDHCDEENFQKMAEIVMQSIESLPVNPGIVFEADMLKKNGDPIHVEIIGKVLLDDAGSPISLQGVTRDVTERKRAQKERETLNEQLSQAQKMESIGTLAGGIAHDFNNILSSVIGFTELALDEVEKESTKDSLHEVYAAGKRAKDLVRQILAFARQSDEEIKPVQISSIAKEALKFIRSSIPTTIEIKEDLGCDSMVMGNSTQIHQLFMNLCTNAAHAMENQGGVLYMQIQDVVVDNRPNPKNINLKPGEYVEIKVSDSGVGIEPKIIDAIFEPYYTTKGVGEGTGMGLAMVKGIIESYGGQINVTSQLGNSNRLRKWNPLVL